MREVREELGLRGRRWTAGWPGRSPSVGGRHELTVALATLLDGDPIPHEHDAVRWLGPDELDEVDWLEPDRPFLPELRGLLLALPRLG